MRGKQRLTTGRILGIGAGELTGVRPVAAAVRGSVAAHRERWALIRQLAQGAFAKQTDSLIPDDITDPADRFKVAQRVHGVPDNALDALEKKKWNGFLVAIVMLTGTIVLGIISLQASTRFQDSMLFGFLVSFSLTPLATAFVVKAAFQHWQVRTRRLGSVSEWLAHPDAWWPAPADGDLGARIVRIMPWLITLGAGALVLFSGSADAQTMDATFRTDIPGKVLTAIGASGGTPLTKFLGVYAARIEVVAACLLAWHSLSALVDAAHTGQTLSGGKWHQVWSPIRVVIGFAMLVPSPTSGLNLGMELVLTLAAAGSNWASDQWAEFVSDTLIPDVKASDSGASTSTGGTGLGIPSAIGGMEVVRQVLRSDLCVQTFKIAPVATSWTTFWFGQPLLPTAPNAAGVASSDGTEQVWDYGWCGQIRVPLTASVPGSSGNSAAATAFVEARIAAVGAVITGVEKSGLAAQMASSQQPGATNTGWPQNIVAQLTSLGSAYDASMLQASAKAVYAERQSSYNQLSADALANGWPVAGAYYRTLYQASETVAEVASQPPSFHAPNVGRRNLGVDTILKTSLATLDEQWSIESAQPSLSGAELAEPGDANSDPVTGILGPLTKPQMQGIINLGTTNATDPMETEMALGHGLLVAGESAIVAGGVVAVASGNELASMAGAGAAFTWGAPFAQLIIGGALVIGWSHAVLMPMLPFISVIYLFIGWVVLLGEALVASPLFFLQWCRMDSGDELVGPHQKAGVVILFNLLLMPILGIAGVVFNFYALPLAMSAVNSWFAPAFVGVQGGHIVGLFLALGGLAMLTYLEYQVTIRITAVITQIPDFVSRLFGAVPSGARADEATRSTYAALVAGGSSGIAHARSAAERAKPKIPSIARALKPDNKEEGA